MSDSGHLRLEFDRSNRHLSVYVAGELDMDSAPQFTRAINDHLSSDLERLWLDLAAVSFCDSSGLQALLAVHEQSRQVGADCVIYAPSSRVYRLLEMTDLVSHLQVHRPPNPAAAS